MINDKPSVLEVVRSRLKDGRSIADHDIHQLVSMIDNLQKVAFESNHEYDKTRTMLRAEQWSHGQTGATRDRLMIENERLRVALIDHNEMLRSAFEAAQRDAIHDTAGTTNFRLLADRMSETLARHHSITNSAKKDKP